MAKAPEISPEIMQRIIDARDARLREAGVPVSSGGDGDAAPRGYETDDLVMEAGANAPAAAHEAAERFRESRADTLRPDDAGGREAEVRASAWAPASILPTIPARAGWHFRWVRLSARGENDDLNANQAFREGYSPATAEDIGNIHLSSDASIRFPGGIEVGGLLLCKIPEEIRRERERYYHEQAMGQVRGVNNDLLRENDPRMPLLRPSSNSRTTFGVR